MSFPNQKKHRTVNRCGVRNFGEIATDAKRPCNDGERRDGEPVPYEGRTDPSASLRMTQLFEGDNLIHRASAVPLPQRGRFWWASCELPDKRGNGCVAVRCRRRYPG